MRKFFLTRIAAETWGLLYGVVAVGCFSLTLPATRVAVADFDATVVGLGRALLAAVLAALFLLFTRSPWPTRPQFKGLSLVAAGSVVGFPLLTAWAMQRVPASHGAIVFGLLPLATAVAGVVLAGERPSLGFWLASGAGSATVVAFALLTGGGQLHLADMALLGAVVTAAIGYAEGGRLARELGGAPVICWALLVAAPFLVVPVALAIGRHGLAASPAAWLGLAYVSVVSAFLGMVVWYRGLALGGIARVGQMQLLQPFGTLFASAWLLGEQMTVVTVGFAVLVVAWVALGRKAVVKRA